MTRLIKLDPDDFTYLDNDDECWHFGEYTSGGGYNASTTNQQILNLKKKPTASQNELYYKRKAVNYWANLLFSEGAMRADACQENVTFVPFPCSKPIGHADYDDRILRVLRHATRNYPEMDIRPLILQRTFREAQHSAGHRLDPHELMEHLAIDTSQLQAPFKSFVVVVDDVITRGSSYAAAKRLIKRDIGAHISVQGLFLAKTVQPPFDFDEDF